MLSWWRFLPASHVICLCCFYAIKMTRYLKSLTYQKIYFKVFPIFLIYFLRRSCLNFSNHKFFCQSILQDSPEELDIWIQGMPGNQVSGVFQLFFISCAAILEVNVFVLKSDHWLDTPKYKSDQHNQLLFLFKLYWV